MQRKPNKLIAMLLTSAFVCPATAFAQNNDDIDEIIVTGRKKAETILEAPISITAFSDSAIEEAGIQDVRQVGDFTPGLTFTADLGRNAERPSIRGIANLRAETPQPVSIFVDGVYIRSGVVSTILDNVERIEVLKGPQAALYGRSTYGGVINYITKTPGDETGGRLSVMAATDDDYSVSGYVDGPISETLRGTFGAYYKNFGGAFDNDSPFAGGRDVGSEKTKAVYGKLRWEPADNFNMNLSLNYSEDRDGQFAGSLQRDANNSGPAGGTACSDITRSAFCGVIPTPDSVNIATSIPAGTAQTTVAGTATSIGDFEAGLDRDIFRLGLTSTLEFENGITLTSLTGYTDENLVVNTNQSYSNEIFEAPFNSFNVSWATLDENERSDFYQEFRLASPVGQKFEWLLGGIYYGNEQTNVGRDLDEELSPDPGASFQESEIAGFGRVAYNATDELSIGFEGRYYEEEFVQLGSVAGQPNRTAKFSGFSPRFTIDYQVTPETLIYGLAARGNKRGGFNDPRATPPQDTFNEEIVWSYEGGLKTRTFDNRLTLTAAAFLNKLQDQQLSQSATFNAGTPDQITITVVDNIGKSEVFGIELDAGFDVTDELFVRATYALADGEITEGNDPGQGSFYGGDTSIVGFKIPRVSKHSATLTSVYTKPTDFGEMYVRGDALYNSSRFAAVQNIVETGDSFVVNARIGARLNDNIDISLFGNNIFSDDAATNVFRYVDTRSGRFFARGSNVAFLRRPAHFGARLIYDF